MTGYEQKWHEVCKLDPSSYLSIFQFKSDMIIFTTRDTYVDDINGLTLYVKLLFQTLNFNYAFNKEVYDKYKDLLSAAIGYEISFEEAERLASNGRRENRELNEFVDDVKRMFRKIPNEIKEDIILLCLILGCVDKRPSYKVRTFLNRFYIDE